MCVACASIFHPEPKKLQRASDVVEKIFSDELMSIKEIASIDIDRLVFLGSGSLNGTAQEAALKCLELTAGNITAYSNSSLGFRHGPKFAINAQTMVFLMKSSSPYTKKYDDDLAKELAFDDCAKKVVTLSVDEFGIEDNVLDDFWLSFAFIVYSQIFALYSAIRLNIPSDNPSPSGEVNRVVSGVTIYEYK